MTFVKAIQIYYIHALVYTGMYRMRCLLCLMFTRAWSTLFVYV